MEIKEKWDRVADNYQNTFEKGRNDYNVGMMRFLTEKCGLGPKSRVIDIGCGVGKYGVMFAEMGCEVTLTDISSEMLRYAEENMSEKNCKYRIICADWNEISFDGLGLNQKFDIAISTMSPAITDTTGVKKMSAVTDGWCLISRFFEWNDHLSEQYCRILGIPVKSRTGDMRTDCENMLRCVAEAGYMPLVQYVDYNWTDIRTHEESAERFVNRYLMGEYDENLYKRALLASEKLVEENGAVKDSVSTKVAWIYWNTMKG